MFKSLMQQFNDRVDSLDNENGMEAAQVILILFLVVIGLIPVIIMIKNSLAGRSSEVDSSINSNQWRSEANKRLGANCLAPNLSTTHIRGERWNR